MLDLVIAKGSVGMLWLGSWAIIGGLYQPRIRRMLSDEIEGSGRRPGLWQEWLQQFRTPGSDAARRLRRRVYLEIALLTTAMLGSFLLLDAAF